MKKNATIKKLLRFADLTQEVLDDSRLNLSERVILSILINFSNIEYNGYCFASNKFFVNNLNCSLSNVSNSIKKLRELGYITKNEPDPDHGGRCYRRYIRIDLLNNGESSNIKSSLVNSTIQPTTKQKHNIISNNKVNNNYISIEKERELVQHNLNTSFLKWPYYSSYKNLYNNAYSIEWNKKNILDLIYLCNRMNQYIETKHGKIQPAHYSPSLNALDSFLSCKPKFFTDCLPRTFLSFFDKVTSQEIFLTRFKNDFDTDDEGGFVRNIEYGFARIPKRPHP